MSTEVADRDEQERKSGGGFPTPKEVRAEARKVTWTSRQETLIYTIFVLALVVLAAGFFFLTDMLVHALVTLILSFAA